MSKNNVHIDRLEIRMKGISPEAARASANGLGSEVLESLGAIANQNGSKRGARIGKIDAGHLNVNSTTGSAGLRQRIAQQVANSVRSRMK
jgi:hypothetical protein